MGIYHHDASAGSSHEASRVRISGLWELVDLFAHLTFSFVCWLIPARRPKLGYFFDKCPIHTETCGDSWYDYRAGPNYNDSMATAFTRWYYQGISFREGAQLPILPLILLLISSSL